MNLAGNLSIAAGEGGGCVYAGDGGSALMAPMCAPYALAFDPAGDLFVTDGSCSCVRRLEAQSGILQTVAGTGVAGIGSDGIPATQSPLTPGAITIAGGSLYLVDALSASTSRIRAVTPPVPPALPQPPAITRILDAVNYQFDFSPGAIVTLYGNYLGPQAPLTGQIGTNGLLTSSLAGDQVTFNNIPAPLLYVSAGQINAVMPV